MYAHLNYKTEDYLTYVAIGAFAVNMFIAVLIILVSFQEFKYSNIANIVRHLRKPVLKGKQLILFQNLRNCFLILYLAS